ncbi:hypothetical protein PGT21_023150 [Puccinia graminis f. sp. tritici]|uniref:Uncharacterized protein n=1 Tax=Puccinia graminis f. sp. tritici TaxID=56615 RepID=A0A5B0R220_PUCGR|nr:hypothetical protein PGT21_023150 [Puccinia graminis f. sp. tritici]
MASLGTGYPLGYPDIRQVWAEKWPSAAESAPAGGYPLALAGIRQGIADIRGGLSPPISILLWSLMDRSLTAASASGPLRTPLPPLGAPAPCSPSTVYAEPPFRSQP